MNLNILHTILDPRAIIAGLGLLGVFTIVFAETGLFFGFFFPGDSLLFTAGFLASAHYLSLSWLLIGSFIAAVIGDSVGYWFGKKIGPTIFKKDESIFFNKKHIERAQHFFTKYGKKTIILARFVPIVRTFAPILAGVGQMEYRTFISFNVIGGFIWTWGLLWMGYGFGSIIPNPDRYIIPVIAIIILVSVIPTAWEFWKAHKGK